MIDASNIAELEKQAYRNFERIQKSLIGLYEVLSITYGETSENICFKAGQDNIIGLYENLLELLLNEKGLNHLVRSIKDSKIKLDVTLSEY
ncbi:MAG: hypothetical protein JW891_05570 [Candidatus Lokiarchaeota archaeon]|nr:hypothetical protein [Candidatus Lokiarchaeota archaeon]